jgi:hypothetical protein
MRVRRDISSIPYESAGETWQRIVDLVTRLGSKDAQQLNDVGGIMGSIIADEHPAKRAIILEGVGAQLRIYCRYGMRGRGGRGRRRRTHLESDRGRLDAARPVR